MNAVILPDWSAPANVRAFSTTRAGGRSVAPYAGLNLGDHVGDDPRAVVANRLRLPELVPDLPREPVWLSQVHGVRCVDLRAAHTGVEADAALSREPGLVCAILTADCLPVLLCNDAGTVVAAAHCGWRGLAGGVIEKTVRTMACPGTSLQAWLGPAIGPRAFEVGDEVKQPFVACDAAADSAFVPHGAGKWLCDLYALARRRLAALGVTRVFGGDFCTYENAERFYSYRRDGRTGRMGTFIWLDGRHKSLHV